MNVYVVVVDDNEVERFGTRREARSFVTSLEEEGMNPNVVRIGTTTSDELVEGWIQNGECHHVREDLVLG